MSFASQSSTSVRRCSASSLSLTALSISSDDSSISSYTSSSHMSPPTLRSSNPSPAVSHPQSMGGIHHGWGSVNTRKGYHDLKSISCPTIPPQRHMVNGYRFSDSATTRSIDTSSYYTSTSSSPEDMQVDDGRDSWGYFVDSVDHDDTLMF